MRKLQKQSGVLSEVRTILAIEFLFTFLKIGSLVILLVTSSSDYCSAQDSSCGIVWYPPIQLSDGNYGSYAPKIAVTGDETIHVTWTGSPAKYRLPYIRSVTNGQSWEPIRDLVTDTVEFPVGFTQIALVTEGQRVYVFANSEYESQISQPQENALAKSTNGGATWEPLKRVGPDSAVGMWSASAYHDTLVVVYNTWHGPNDPSETREIYSTDGGAAWVQTNDTLDSSTRTVLVGSTLHLVRQDFLNDAIEKLYLRSNDFGNTFPHSEILSTLDGRNAFEHDIAYSISGADTAMILVWRETKYGCLGFGGCSVVLRETHDNGNSWQSEQVITDEPRGVNPAIAMHKDTTVIVWENEESFLKFHIYLKARFGHSSNWSQVFDLTPVVEDNSGTPDVAVSSVAIYVVWSELVGGSLGTWRVFYRRGVFTNLNATTSSIAYEGGWNLVSLPVRTDSIYKLPSLFRYDGSYVSSDSLVNGVGYWAKPDTQFRYFGSFVSAETVDVKLGWNIIGSLSCPTHIGNINTIPTGIIVSNFFGYSQNAYYQAEIIEPGRGYWVKVSQSGKLVLKMN
jgi:hypothetical protein